MKSTVLILLIAAPIGAADVVYFHLWKFKLYQRPQSRREEVVHLLRGLVFPLGLAILLIGRPEGLWFWGLLGLFVIDTINTLIDGLLEPSSRAPLVVPPAELAVHYLGTTMIGLAAATFAIYGWKNRSLPTALADHTGADALSSTTIVMGAMSVVLAVCLWLFEATLFARALRGSQTDHLVGRSSLTRTVDA